MFLFNIADNLELGEFDYDKLANEWELEELQDWGIEMPEIGNLNFEIDEKQKNKDIEIKNKCPKCGFEW